MKPSQNFLKFFTGYAALWWRSLSVLMIALLWITSIVRANPTDGQVRAGQATISTSGSTLTVNQLTDRAIIHWQDFSIPAGSTTKFVQPSATSAALNRVLGGNPSQIYGNLEANGQVYLINPNGVLVGASGVVNTAGFIASTLDISDENFLSGGDLRFKGTSDASVVNLGKISGSERDVILIARTVENHGTIEAPKGTAALAAGSEVLVKATGDERVFVQAGSSTEVSTATQAGLIKAAAAEIKAAGGNEYALAIKHSGVTRATGVTKEGGRILLSAGKGKVEQSGKLVARTSTKSGGKVRIEADHVELTKKSKIDVSGEGVGNGGEVLIGGGYQGKDTSIRNAQTVTAEARSVILADGGTEGKAGTVILWSDGTTNFAGDISAQGGSVSGDGGFVEVSGKEHLAMSGLADLSATDGTFGHLLLDPGSVVIQDGPNTGPPPAMNAFYDEWIANQLGLSNVTIQTSASNVGTTETITVNGNVEIVWNTPTTLTLEAGRNITVDSGALIENTHVGTNFDAIVLRANPSQTVHTASFVAISHNGEFSTASGNIVLIGHGASNGSNVMGVRFGTSSVTPASLKTTQGNIHVEGSAYGAGPWNYGVYVNNGTTIISEATDTNATVTLKGSAPYPSTGDRNTGLYHNGLIQSLNADILIEGERTANTGAGSNGILMGAFANVNSLGSGNIVLSAAPNPIAAVGPIDLNLHRDTVIQSGSGDIVLRSDQASSDLGRLSSTGGGRLLIETWSADRNIGIATTATDALNLTTVGLNRIQDGFSEIVIGREDGSGAITVGSYTFKDNVTLRTPVGNGDITLNGDLATGSGTEVGKITLQAGRSILGSSGASITTQGQDIILNSDRDETGGGNIQLTTTSIASNGGDITLGGGNDPATTVAIGMGTGSTQQKVGIYLSGGSVDAGAGTITLRGQGISGTSAAYGIFLTGGGKIGSASSTGDITLHGTGGDGTTDNYGVYLTGSGTQVSSSGSGAIAIIGQGGIGSGANNHGIYMAGAAQVSSTGTATATVTLNGTGGKGTSGHRGVYVTGANTTVQSKIGNIHIIGQGGEDNATVGRDYLTGIEVTGGAQILSSGTAAGAAASITLEGTGGLSTGIKTGTIPYGYTESHGITLSSTTTKISSAYGDISLTGKGGSMVAQPSGISASTLRGIYFGYATIESTGTGLGAANISLKGTGTVKYGQDQGMWLSNSAIINSKDGNISMEGHGNVGLLLGGTTVTSTGSGNIYMTGTRLPSGSDDIGYYGGTVITSGTGNITTEANSLFYSGGNTATLQSTGGGSLYFIQRTAETSIGIGGGSGTLNLTTAALNNIKDGFSEIIIGHEDGTGLVTVGTYPAFKDNLTIRTPKGNGDITVTGALATGSGSEAGTITLIAGRNIIGNSGASIKTQGKTITLNSDRDKGTITDTGGGRIELIKVTVESNGGDIILGGGLDPLTQDAVNAATTGGTRGISVNSGSILSSGSGSISMRGSGGTVAGNRGVEVSGSSTIVSSTTGSIVLYGTGGSAGTSQEMGVALSSQLKSDTGNITITGNSGGGNSAGILMSGSTIIESGDGATITFNGIGTGTGAGVYVWRDAGTAVTVIGNASRKNVAIMVNSDNLSLARESSGKITTEFISSGTITFQPITQGTTIGIGGGSGKLSLAKAQIDTLMDGFSEIIIGNETSGNMTVNASTFTDNLRLVTGGNMAVNGALNVGGNRLALIVGGNTTQSAAITAGSLRLGGDGNFILTNVGNSIGTLAKDGAGSVALNHAAALTVGSVDGVDGVTGSTVDLRTNAGDLTLNKPVVGAASGNAVVLSTPAGFINNVGSGAVVASAGRWLIYSNAPADDTFGALMSGNNALWNRTITSHAPAVISQTGNRYIFATQPSLTVTASLVGSKTYGDTYTYPTLAEGTNYHVSGFVNAATYGGVFSQDSAVTIGLTGDPGLSSTGAPASAVVAGSPYDFTITQGTLVNTAGYKFGTFTSGGSLTVNPRPITFVANTATKTYGDADPAVSVRIGSGSLGGTDSLADVTGTITRESGEPVGAYDIQLGAGTKASNYTITYLADNDAFTITPRAITFVANTATKTYGDADPAVSVRIGSGSLAGWDSQGEVTGTITREVGENAGLYDIQIGTGSKASNYTITYLADNDAFRIAPKALTITAHDATRPHLQPNPSFSVSYAGFIPGEGLGNLGGSLSITTPATLSSSPGQYRITPFGLSSGNYAITFVDGALTIFNQTGAELLQTSDMADPENFLMEADNMTDTEGRHLKDWRKKRSATQYKVEYGGSRHYPGARASLSSGEVLQGPGGGE